MTSASIYFPLAQLIALSFASARSADPLFLVGGAAVWLSGRGPLAVRVDWGSGAVRLLAIYGLHLRLQSKPSVNIDTRAAS